MSYSLNELRQIPDEQLIVEHDNHAKHTQVGINYYLDELYRRDQNHQTEAMALLTKDMLKYTKWITIMTLVVTVATIINVALLLIAQP